MESNLMPAQTLAPADIQTRIYAAQHRYGYNRRYGPVERIMLGTVGMLCVIMATWRKRIGRWMA